MAGDTTTPGTARSMRFAWVLILSLLALDLAWLPFTQVTIVPFSLALPLGAGAALFGVARYYERLRNEPKFADALDCISQIVTFSAAGALFSYLVVTPGFPMQDALFHALDMALGLDWLAYLRWLDHHAWLSPWLSLSYQSFLFQVIIVIAVLSFSGRGLAARTMILSMMIAAVVIIAISGLLPARSTFAFLNLSPADYPNLRPAAAFIHLRDLMALHGGEALHVDLRQAHGIITFPSYHAALGLLLLIGGWHHVWLRWPTFLVNLAMIVATPVDGGHYFVDVIAGLVIAALSYLASYRFLANPIADRAMTATPAPGALVTDH